MGCETEFDSAVREGERLEEERKGKERKGKGEGGKRTDREVPVLIWR